MDAPPKKKWALTQEDFDRLLAWLNPDRECAGQKYEKIRSALTNRFRRLNCVEPEARANETIDRVAQTLPKVIAKYKGDPEPYFYSVAYYIYLEYLNRPEAAQLPEKELPDGSSLSSADSDDDDESRDEVMDSCLSRCLNKLDEEDRQLILEYYGGERQGKIKYRKELSEKFGVTQGYLRVIVRRIKVKLKNCILDCLSGETRD